MKTTLLLLLLAGTLFPGTRAIAADWHVWTVTDTRHVLRSAKPEAALAVHVSAARNEWVAFLFLLRADQAVAGFRV